MATMFLIVDIKNFDFKYWNIFFYRLWGSLSIIFCGVSVFASTALSVDRLLALFLGLRYRHVVTLKRVRAVLACGCLALLLIMLVWYFHAKTCKISMPIFWTLCLIISLFSYTKIVLRLRQHQFSVQDNVQQGQANTGRIPLNLERYKKTVVSIALVQLALVICYFPSSIVFILIHLKGMHPSIDFILHGYCATLVFLNSSLNPFLYCWRIKEIRKAVKATIRRFCTSEKNTFSEAVEVRHLASTARRMVNLTEDGNVTVMETLLSANIRVGFYIALAAVNIVLSIMASLGNVLILIALRNVTSIHPPTKLLFQCLAITDLGVGLISQPLMVARSLIVYIKNLDLKFWNIFSHLLFRSSSIIFSGLSVFASTALSVDRLLALFLGLRYRHVVTLKRVRAILACGCLAFLLIMLVCYFHVKTGGITMAILYTLCLIISLFSYTKIVIRLRQHQSSVGDNVQQGQANTGGMPLNLKRYKKNCCKHSFSAASISYMLFSI
ncbi:unnamed protein product [Porites evermanni]|uniref:G-protein coupled receptors family 1 profile domain-containing protein n=1 Tax=Porites evermanni TaxID=104178 RepID=A0ABN8LMR4_9CNID|nr:unnamed protein product [Porites evermanni]